MALFDEAPKLVTSFIDGGFVGETNGYRIPDYYPGNGQQFSELQEADEAEVDAAVRAARTAFRDGPWPRFSVEERQDILMRIHDAIIAHSDELALLECLDTGILMREIRGRHLIRAAYNFRFFAEAISQQPDEAWAQQKGFFTYVTRDPVGVAGLIAPWNAPLALASMKLAAATAFGNCCVLKPSEQTPAALARLVEIMHEAGLPRGVVNIVNGRGDVTGRALVEHPDVDVVHFTGGTETGRTIARTMGGRLRRAEMELGGKSANIVFADADFDRALDAALVSIFSNSGQQCLAGSRIVVQDSIADDFIAAFVERAKRIRVGDPMSPETEMGPIASDQHRRRILSYVGIAESEGARLLTGGGALDRAGYFMEPTAVLAASNESRVCQEEIFGPFASFLRFKDAEEAVAIANASQFGLVSYLWTQNLDTAMRVSRRIAAGVVWINTPLNRELRAPFGGVKDSGTGRDGAASSRAFFTIERTTTIPLEDFPLRRFGAEAAAEPDAMALESGPMKVRDLDHELLPTVTQADRSRQTAVVSIRRLLNQHVRPRNVELFDSEGAPAFIERHGRAPQSPAEVESALFASPGYRRWSAVNRAVQENIWLAVGEPVYRDLPRTRAAAKRLASAVTLKGGLKLDPDISVPGALADNDVHLQPGGYTLDNAEDDIVAGSLYEAGGNVYSFGQGAGRSDSKAGAVQRYLADVAPEFRPARILEIGCSAGAASAAWAAHWPDAEVHAIDLGAGMLRYAHARAEALGVPVFFHQMNGASLAFAEDSFDLVVSHNLLHEIGREERKAMMHESARVTRPGGMVIHQDIALREQPTVVHATEKKWDARFNGEIFWTHYTEDDLAADMRAAGFDGEYLREDRVPAIHGSGAWYILCGKKRCR